MPETLLRPSVQRRNGSVNFYEATHFVSIATYMQKPIFGEVRGGRMDYSLAGELARICWVDLQTHFPQVHLDVFTVMPSAFYALLCAENLHHVIERFKKTAEREITTYCFPRRKHIWQPGFEVKEVRTDVQREELRRFTLECSTY